MACLVMRYLMRFTNSASPVASLPCGLRWIDYLSVTSTARYVSLACGSIPISNGIQQFETLSPAYAEPD